jgi:AcrR family transcriptional regulator
MMESQVPHLRADALENREHILVSARALFSQQGLDIGMREIARKAKVGPATLYRRFPTKQALIDEAFSIELRECREIVSDGCENRDAWLGFVSTVERLIALNVQNKGFVDAYTSTTSATELIAAHRRDLLRMLAGLARRAQEMGSLRPDFRMFDLTLMLRAAHGLTSGDRTTRASAGTRFAELVIDAFMAHGDSTLPA